MSYRIEKGEPLPTAFGRIAGEEFHLALTELDRRATRESVHNVRKAIKRVRALLRSLRDAVPERAWRRENRRLGDAGRKMSPVRDVQAQLRALRKLNGSGGGAAPLLRARLRRDQRKIAREIPTLRRALRISVRRSQREIDSFAFRLAAPGKVAAGLKKIYRQGRQRFEKAGRRASPENLHEWRKKVKALGYALDLLEELSPKKLSSMRKDSEELGDLLGDDHDLFHAFGSIARRTRRQSGRGLHWPRRSHRPQTRETCPVRLETRRGTLRRKTGSI